MSVIATDVTSIVSLPSSGFWSVFERYFQIVGYSRAAAELARNGQVEAAKSCMDQLGRLHNGR